MVKGLVSNINHVIEQNRTEQNKSLFDKNEYNMC